MVPKKHGAAQIIQTNNNETLCLSTAYDIKKISKYDSIYSNNAVRESHVPDGETEAQQGSDTQTLVHPSPGLLTSPHS